MSSAGAPAGVPLGNFLSLGAGEVAARGLAFLATALLARRLGASAFGVLGFAFAITSYLIVAPSSGIQDLATRAVARRPEAAGRITASIVKLRLLLGLGGLALLSGLTLMLPKPPLVRAVVALSRLCLLPLALNTSWAYKALERTRRVSLSLLLAQAAYAAGILLAVQGPNHLLRVPLAQALGEAAAALLLVPILRGAWRGGSLREGAAALQGAGVVTLGRMLRTFIVTSDVVLLSFLANDRQVGLYSAAYRVCFLLSAIAVSASIVFLPSLSRAREEPAAAAAVLGRSLWLSWTVGLPLVVGGVLVAPDLLALLFGPEYRAGGDAFRWLLVSIGLFFLHSTLRNVFLVRDRLALQTAILGAAAAVNLALNLVLIPSYGLVGAALATLTAEALILGAGASVIMRWGWRPALRPLARPAIAAAVMGGLLLITPDTMHLALRIPFGGLVYAAVLGLVGGFPPEVRRLIPLVRA